MKTKEVWNYKEGKTRSFLVYKNEKIDNLLQN